MSANGVPADLAAGACMELWVGDDGKPPIWWERVEIPWQAVTAWRRFQDARRAWGNEHGLTHNQLNELVPSASPYSARYLADTGREAEARRRLGPLGDRILCSGASTRYGTRLTATLRTAEGHP